MDMNRNIYEGWTPQDFIDTLQPQLDTIMSGRSWKKPFETKEDLYDWIKENQPYYKRPIKEVNQYFSKRYNLW